jgi:hypothetical protein
MTKNRKPNYLAKVKQLTKDETDRLLSRMGGKLPRRLEKRKLSQEEALAMQLEYEDEQLHEWRKVMLSLKKKEEAKQAKKEAKKKAKAPSKAKVHAKTKAPTKTKAPAKSKVRAKTRTPAKTKATIAAKVEPGIT